MISGRENLEDIWGIRGLGRRGSDEALGTELNRNKVAVSTTASGPSAPRRSKQAERSARCEVEMPVHVDHVTEHSLFLVCAMPE